MKTKAKDQPDGQLMAEMVYWFRVGRTEGGLKGPERKYFRDVCKEIAERGLLRADTGLYRAERGLLRADTGLYRDS